MNGLIHGVESSNCDTIVMHAVRHIAAESAAEKHKLGFCPALQPMNGCVCCKINVGLTPYCDVIPQTVQDGGEENHSNGCKLAFGLRKVQQEEQRLINENIFSFVGVTILPVETVAGGRNNDL